MVNQDELHALRNAWRLLGPDWNRRIQAAALLGEASAAEAIPDLEAVAIENKHPDLAKAAIRALGQIHDETALAAVGRVLNGTPDKILAAQCLDVLLLRLQNGSSAASQTLVTESCKLFPILLNRARQDEMPARQAILGMGEQGIKKLIEALLSPATRDIAGSLLVEFGEAAAKPLLQALSHVNEVGSPAIQDVLARVIRKNQRMESGLSAIR